MKSLVELRRSSVQTGFGRCILLSGTDDHGIGKPRGDTPRIVVDIKVFARPLIKNSHENWISPNVDDALA